MPNSNNSLSTYTSMMRVTSTGRPFAKDLFDIFGAFLIQTPLKDHRSIFRTYPNSITTDEAVLTLSDLKFVHVIRTPDPNDPNVQIATRTTTTFSMTREMAKTLGQHMLNSRLAENAADPQNRTMKDRATWYVTPKGKYMVQDFSQRAGVSISHIQKSLDRIDSFRIVKFDRLIDTDSLSFARPNMTTAFKTMMAWLPTETLLADDVGEKQAHEYTYTFYGYQCFEWICEYTTVVSGEEGLMIAAEFVLYGWIVQVLDKSDKSNSIRTDNNSFKTTKRAIYYVTERGRKVLGWQTKPTRSPSDVSLSKQSDIASSSSSSVTQSQVLRKQMTLAKRLAPTGLQASSNSQWTRLRQILEDPLLRMYFRDFMKANFCEENINFWVDYYSLRKKARSRRMIISELLTDCYTIYDTYLGMQAASEVNIDHGLRQEIITLVTRTFTVAPGSSLDMPFLNIPIQPTLINVTVNGSNQQCLQVIMRMYDKVNDHICRLMAQDSVPRFVKTEKYQQFMSQNSTPI
ncbi:regulator of G protein signaling domain-containing protein [Phycomyces blakesleeanus]|uniref:Regulator of G protein signaling domain-containing protein n=1 Tax=Phycomyces blakesleeanus TaxID=4837 RepID=A0ABR3AR09_PHYBL